MSVYLHDIPLPEALSRIEIELETAGLWKVIGCERIPVNEDAVGRILTGPVWAKLSSPHYHASAMDGFAVMAADTMGAQPTSPLTIMLPDKAAYVDTGDPLPIWANAVIPIENVEPLDSSGNIKTSLPRSPTSIRIRSTVTPWSHVRPMGEDIVATELVLPAGQVIRPVDLGAIAACGQTEIEVAKRPKVAILPTGTELVPVGQTVKPGDIIEYNSIVLAGQIRMWGGEPHRYPITVDNFEQIKSRVAQAALDNDLVLLNAGSSAGSEDFSSAVISSLGKVIVHGVAVRPGHPVIIGLVSVSDPNDADKIKQVPVIGVPGYPVSAALTGEIFIEPIIAKWLGREPIQPIIVEATITRKITSPAGDDDYMRVAVGNVGDKLLAAPLSRGAGVITSLVKADGISIIPRGVQGLEAGETIPVRLYRNPAALNQTVFAIGSHDITLDLLAQYLASNNRRLVSVNVGSLGGLVALRRGEAHLAGSHLLDPATGAYNISYIRQYLPGISVKVLGWVGRSQGLLVLPGNPKRIFKLEDLIRPDVRFINRQRGAGTRVLLDYHLGLLGLRTTDIQGYPQEEYTHLSVAAAVSSGRADCGLGIAAAAQALGLDFIPLFDETYQLIVPSQYFDSPLFAPIMELAHRNDFQRAVLMMPGYDVSHMGEIIHEIDCTN